MDTINVQIKTAWMSKINWTQAISGAAMLVTFLTGGKLNITPEQQVDIVVTIGVVTNIITWVIKTWFTPTVTPSSLPAK
jgi:hypothetical protein